MSQGRRFWTRLATLLLYVLPGIVALVFVVNAYRVRAIQAGEDIRVLAERILTEGDGSAEVPQAPGEQVSDDIRLQLEEFLRGNTRQFVLGVEGQEPDPIDATISRIWQRNASITALMTLLPFLLLGYRLAFDPRVPLTPSQRVKSAWQHWSMRLAVAAVIALGWIYVLNPLGRGGSTVKAYLNANDVLAGSTLPIYLASKNLSHAVAGFLGWYLYQLSYLFSKLYHNDVASSRVYRFLFGKFLFTYGVAVVFSATTGPESVFIVFLIGYFPLSALDLIRQAGVKAAQGDNAERAVLTELPSISNWQILRLQEEGITSLATLATSDQEDLRRSLPGILAPLIGLWADAAQLYTVLGKDRYQAISSRCITASEFIRRSGDAEFRKELAEAGLHNPDEVLRLLERTFGDRLKVAAA